MSPNPVQQLPRAAEAMLLRFVHRRRRLALLGAGGRAASVALLWLGAWGVVDRMVAVPTWGRAALLMAIFSVAAVILLGPLLAVFRGAVDWRGAALQVEGRDPRFGESLATVVSESLAPPQARGSAQLVEHLASHVESLLQDKQDVTLLLPIRPALRPWLTAAVLAGMLAGLSFWPWLDLPRLLGRQLAPLSGLAPATTTHIAVLPGSIDVVQGTPLTIKARAEPLDGSSVILRVSTDGQTWTTIGMAPAPDGSYAHSLTAIWRDTRYEVVAGDAVSGPHSIRVLWRPLVREFRIRLVYPRYIGRAPLAISNADGSIQAPAGTEAEVTAVASGPLKAAWFTVNGARLDASLAPDRTSCQIRIPITRDGHYELEMLSDRDVRGAGPPDMTIRAISDRPPIARAFLPATYSLLRPGDVVQVAYQAADDYGLASLEARVQVNQNLVQRIPLRTGADPRRCDGSLKLDLPGLKVAEGDAVNVTLAVVDRAGQSTLSLPCRILLSPQPVDASRQRRGEDRAHEGNAGGSRTQAGLDEQMDPPPRPEPPEDARPGAITYSRPQALDAVRQAQERLAELPEPLGKVEDSVGWVRQTQNRAEQALRQAQAAAPDQQPAARRAARIVEQQADDAFAWMAQLAQGLDPERVGTVARALRSCLPETEPAIAPIERQLIPALKALRQAVEMRRPDDAERAIADARRAIALAQDGLRDARQMLLERDPLVAARWFTEQAAASVATTRPASNDGHSQDQTLATLGRAWDESIYRAAARAWEKLRPWGAESPDSSRQVDPPEYQEALRIYFEVLERSAQQTPP